MYRGMKYVYVAKLRGSANRTPDLRHRSQFEQTNETYLHFHEQNHAAGAREKKNRRLESLFRKSANRNQCNSPPTMLTVCNQLVRETSQACHHEDIQLIRIVIAL